MAELHELRRTQYVSSPGMSVVEAHFVFSSVLEYSRQEQLPQEAPHEIPDHKPPADWPVEGAIEFKDVVMRYRAGLPFVLKGLSMKINGGEKIGVVGRTGAGKSTLMLALFRIVELVSGSITVDGYERCSHGWQTYADTCLRSIDISEIGLKDLRSKISIIPQDVCPVLTGFNCSADTSTATSVQRYHSLELGSLRPLRT